MKTKLARVQPWKLVMLALSLAFLGWWVGVLPHATSGPLVCDPGALPSQTTCHPTGQGEGTTCWTDDLNKAPTCRDYNLRPWWETPLSYAGLSIATLGTAIFAYAAWRLRADKLALALIFAGVAFLAFLAYIVPRVVLDLTAALGGIVVASILGRFVIAKTRATTQQR